MKKLVGLILSVLVLMLIMSGCTNTVGKTQGSEQDIREMIWNQMSEESKNEIIGTWKDAKLEKVIVNKERVHLLDDKYDGMELYHVVFKTENDGLQGPIGSYVDPETKEIVGGDYRE